jgi:flagellar hook-basal body complex protein FliE
MAIPPIKPIGAGLSVGATSPTQGSQQAGGTGFGNVLGDLIGKLDAGQQQAAQASQDLATGRATDISSVVSQVEKASLEIQLATQVRNKVVDAYNELMRMQI